MEQDLTSYFFENSFTNGFLYFTLGILFILSVFHFLLYFQHKDKVYLYYSCYALFIILSQIHHLEYGFLYRLLMKFPWLARYPTIATEIYFIFYALFAFEFLDLKNQLPKWHKYNIFALYGIGTYCFIVFLIYLFTGDYSILEKGYYIFTVPMILYACVMYIPFFKIKSTLKYYIIIGSFILMSSSIAGLYMYETSYIKNLSVIPAFSVMFIGFILENIIFSLGLGHKQKLILDERDSSKNQLINQLKENEALRKKVQKQLEQDVETLNKQAEIEKLESLKMKYDKELAELKVSALRSQMNPHFIFNSLNSIKRYIIDNEKENAVFYMNKFSKLIRKILASTIEKETTLEEEIETLKLYVNIENIRFNNTIDFELNIEETINKNSIKIPSLITQPFIENAIWHGLSLKKDDKKLTLNVLKLNDNQLQIDIIDNGIGRQRSNEIKKKKLLKRNSVGISLSVERLEHFSKDYKNSSDVFFTDLYDDETPIGTKVTLLIPLS